MKKQYFFLLPVLAVMVLAGAGCPKKDATQQEQSDAASDAAAMENGEAPELSDLFSGLVSEDYRVTITAEGTTAADSFGSIVVEFDAPDKTRSVIESPQGKIETITTPDASYTRIGDGAWLKGQGATIQETDEMNYSKDDLENITKHPDVSYKGPRPCGTGLCHLYSGSYEGDTMSLYVDTVKKRPVKMEVEMKDGTKSEMNYEYTSITVTVPTGDVTSMPTPDQIGNMSPEEMEKMMEQFEGLAQ